MGNDVYEEILYRHWPFPTAFSTASWLSYILLSKTEKKRKIIRFNQQVFSALRLASLRSLTRRIRRLCAAEKADGIILIEPRLVMPIDCIESKFSVSFGDDDPSARTEWISADCNGVDTMELIMRINNFTRVNDRGEAAFYFFCVCFVLSVIRAADHKLKF